MALSTNRHHGLPRSVPLGRLAELRSRDDADLIAATRPTGLWGDYTIRRYNSRAQLEAFCKAGSRHFALVLRTVERGMVVNPNVQREG